MIKQFGDFATTQAYSNSEQLPRGGYVVTIIKAKAETNANGGQYVKIAYDISEGEHTNYFKNKFDRNTNEDKKWPGVYILNVPADDGSESDNRSKRRFKTFTDALEESNKGYEFDWDESKFAGKVIGFVFNYKEYEFNGRTGLTPNVASAYSVQDIRNGKFKIPGDRMLSPGTSNAANVPSAASFMSAPQAGAAEDVPW